MTSLPFKSVIKCDDLSGQYVLLRASINVPIDNGEVRNQFRLVRGLATIRCLISGGARVILVGHIGSDGEASVKPVADILAQYVPVTFAPEVTGPIVKNMRDRIKDGEVLVLENVRRDPREKKNDADFARELADLADIYVNDAFADSHREHASLVGVPKFIPSYVGLNFMHEYEELSKACKPQSPSLFMLGGAKFGTKLPLVEKFLDIYDQIFVGGALANDFFKAKGLEIGQSLHSEVDLSSSPLLTDERILLPLDLTVQDVSGEVRVCKPEEVRDTETILDTGPETIAMLAPIIEKAKMVLWNGPFGDYEKGFSKYTEEVAKLLAAAPGYSVVGGGDTVASIEALGVQDKYNFLSTAGGAMLTFLETGTLPAIEALKENEG